MKLFSADYLKKSLLYSNQICSGHKSSLQWIQKLKEGRDFSQMFLRFWEAFEYSRQELMAHWLTQMGVDAAELSLITILHLSEKTVLQFGNIWSCRSVRQGWVLPQSGRYARDTHWKFHNSIIRCADDTALNADTKSCPCSSYSSTNFINCFSHSYPKRSFSIFFFFLFYYTHQ